MRTIYNYRVRTETSNGDGDTCTKHDGNGDKNDDYGGRYKNGRDSRPIILAKVVNTQKLGATQGYRCENNPNNCRARKYSPGEGDLDERITHSKVQGILHRAAPNLVLSSRGECLDMRETRGRTGSRGLSPCSSKFARRQRVRC